VAQRVLKYCIHNKIPFSWQPHQVVCRTTQGLSSILIWLTSKTGKTIIKSRTHIWVHAAGAIALSHIIVSMHPADLLEFRYCYGSKAAMLVGFLLCTCGLFQLTRPSRYPHDHKQFSSDIEHLQDQEVWNCLILKLIALWFFEMLVTANSQHSKYFTQPEDSATLL